MDQTSDPSDEMVAILQLACYEIGLGTKMSVRNEIGVYRHNSIPIEDEAVYGLGMQLDFEGIILVHSFETVKVAKHRKQFVTLDTACPNFFRTLFRYFGVEDYKINLWYDGHQPFSSIAGLGSFGKPLGNAQ